MTQALFFRSGAVTRLPIALSLCAALVACETTNDTSATEPPEPGVLAPTRNGPADAAPGTCWGKTVSPAVVERVSTQVQIKPAKVNPDGTIGRPPVYRTEEKQVIVTPRRDNWFETPCADVLTPEFIASLQRALSARGGYAGAITGTMDPATRRAVQAFQRADGPDSGVLTLAAARELGLIAVPRETTD